MVNLRITQYANNNPLYYTDPSGHVAIGDSNEGGCNTPGSPRCILDKYYGVPTDLEWMMDMELYYYQLAYPEYDAGTDPYLDPSQIATVMAPTNRAGCLAGSFWSCFGMAVQGAIGTTIAEPIILRPAEPAPQNYGDYADPDCPGCGFKLNAPNPEDILMPGGNPVGKPSDPGVQEVQSKTEMEEIFGALTVNATPINKPGYEGEGYLLPNGGFVGWRDSKKYGPTIDINIPGIPIDKIHLPK